MSSDFLETVHRTVRQGQNEESLSQSTKCNVCHPDVFLNIYSVQIYVFLVKHTQFSKFASPCIIIHFK